jgi:hypothetical protein
MFEFVLSLIVVVGVAVLTGLFRMVSADLKSSHERTSAPEAETRHQTEDPEPFQARLWEANLLLALAGIRKKGHEIPGDALLYRLGPQLAQWKGLWTVERVQEATTVDPRSFQKVMRTPVEELSLPVRTYNAVKRQGLHDIGSLLAASTAALIPDNDDASVARLDDLQMLLVSHLAQVAESGDLSAFLEGGGALDPNQARLTIYRVGTAGFRVRIEHLEGADVEIAETFASEEQARRALREVRAVLHDV